MRDSEAPPGRGWRWAIVLGAVGLVTIAGAVALDLRAHTDLDIGAATFSGQQLVAWSSGKIVWHYDFGQPIRAVEVATPDDVAARVRIVDLNGDGRKEVLVAAPLLFPDRNDASTDGLYCFTSRGKLLWKREFRDTLSFGGEECGPRWEICSLLVSRAGPDHKPSLWCSICSFPMSVSVLFRVAANGQADRYFVNYGHIRALNEIRTPSGAYLLAGGINNEYSCAILAVLKEGEGWGHSPETEASKSACQGCPSGAPYRYFLFPRSEVNQVIGPPYNQISRISVGAGTVEAMTDELGTVSTQQLTGADWALYDLSPDFRPLHATFSDQYWQDHRRLSAEGKIKHSLDNCPERLKPITVRVWSPPAEWTDVELPPVAAKYP